MEKRQNDKETLINKLQTLILENEHRDNQLRLQKLETREKRLITATIVNMTDNIYINLGPDKDGIFLENTFRKFK
jgi:hypothetical protein